MKPLLLLGLFLSSVFSLRAAEPDGKKVEAEAPFFVDVQQKANERLDADLHGFEGNNLAKFPVGVEEFAGVKFSLGQGYIKLGSKVEPKRPKKVEGIKVDAKGVRLRILHGTGYGAYGQPGGPLFVADDSNIGEYVVHYEDDSTATIPIVYGVDVRDWWSWGKPAEVKRGKIAWEGTNDFSEEQKQTIRLYLATWENPKPDLKITKIDYLAKGETAAAPFCIAITLERK